MVEMQSRVPDLRRLRVSAVAIRRSVIATLGSVLAKVVRKTPNRSPALTRPLALAEETHPTAHAKQGDVHVVVVESLLMRICLPRQLASTRRLVLQLIFPLPLTLLLLERQLVPFPRRAVDQSDLLRLVATFSHGILQPK